jgi:hypothetical protein
MKREASLDRALWITWYDLPQAQREVYLDWLQASYVPRVLERRGVLWAAHFRSEANPRQSGVPAGAPGRLRHTDDPAVPCGNAYILLFGAEDAHAFADPAPSEYHAGLPERDRAMLAARRGARSCLFTEEARADGPECALRDRAQALSPCIQLGSFNAGSADDEEILAWYARWRLPAMRRLAGCVGIRKLVSVCGWAKHGVLYEFASLEARDRYFPDHEKAHPEMEAWTDRLVRKLLHAPGSPNVATRLWSRVK